jgi:hypothetical protein
MLERAALAVRTTTTVRASQSSPKFCFRAPTSTSEPTRNIWKTVSESAPRRANVVVPARRDLRDFGETEKAGRY